MLISRASISIQGRRRNRSVDFYIAPGGQLGVDFRRELPRTIHMKREYLLIVLFFLIAAAFFYLFYALIIPFFAPIAWAAVFAILFFPLYESLLKKIKSRGLTSALVCTLIVVLIIGPLAYLLAALVNEAYSAVAKVNETYKSGELEKFISFDLPWLETMKERLSRYYDLSSVECRSVDQRCYRQSERRDSQPDELAYRQRHPERVLLRTDDLHHVLFLQGRRTDHTQGEAVDAAVDQPGEISRSRNCATLYRLPCTAGW